MLHLILAKKRPYQESMSVISTYEKIYKIFCTCWIHCWYYPWGWYHPLLIFYSPQYSRNNGSNCSTFDSGCFGDFVFILWIFIMAGMFYRWKTVYKNIQAFIRIERPDQNSDQVCWHFGQLKTIWLTTSGYTKDRSYLGACEPRRWAYKYERYETAFWWHKANS